MNKAPLIAIAFGISLLASDTLDAQRRLPGQKNPSPTEDQPPPEQSEQVTNINDTAGDFKTHEDRWKLYDSGNLLNPYENNVLKGDRPIFGTQKDPWFLETALISKTIAEYRDVPIPAGFQSTSRPDSNDLFGKGEQFFVAQNLEALLSLYQGNTAFKPQNWEFRFAPVFNFNYIDLKEQGIARADPSRGTTRFDHDIGIQELFIDYHIVDTTARYDFLSLRAGIQPFNADFRGFVFNSFEPGIRLFGNWDNNYYQFNLAYFRRLDKNTNSGLNELVDRFENVVVANLYRQDLFVKGFQAQGVVIHRWDRAGNQPDDYDKNGFIVRPSSIGDERPKNLDTTYLGLNLDGHIHRLNLTGSAYFVFGEESNNNIAGRQVDIFAQMAALELSYDFDWWRLRSSIFYASGDSDPFDGTATGFDAIFDSPNFAGGEGFYFNRQGILFLAGGIVLFTNPNSLLINLRPGKEEGQSNFVNPGVRIFNLGVDIDVLPTLKMFNNFNFIQMDQTAVVKALRQDGSMSRNLGYDFSSSFLYRPWMTNNIQILGGAALFLPEEGFKNLFNDDLRYQMFTTLLLEY